MLLKNVILAASEKGAKIGNPSFLKTSAIPLMIANCDVEIVNSI